MRDKYDVCVVGFWYGSNYGSLLNGYAEYCLLKKMGKSVLMLQKPGTNKNDIEIKTGHNVDFVSKYYDPEDISPIYPYEDLKQLNKICDCFCAGSDQIWNYSLSFHENLYLPFVSESKRLISFATSFGHKIDKVPNEAKPRIRKYLQRYNAISVREQFDVDILKNNYGLLGDLVFEPVFCLDVEEYQKIANNSILELNEPYLLTYILDPTDEKRNAIIEYSKLLGLKAVNVLSGTKSVWEKNKETLNLPNTLDIVSVEDFLKLFSKASFVITDSFHGSAFSIIFNKNFIAIGNYGRGFERFIDLLGRLKLDHKLISTPSNIPIDSKYLEPIDYEPINEIITSEVNRTKAWLDYAVNEPTFKMEPVIKHNIYPDFERVRIMVSLIKEYGIKHIVISSGTRDVTIARVFEFNSDYFNIHLVTDERSAAYFALGLSLKIGEPVAICCTSGTAASNYVPGVTEAFYQHVPLVVITADRYPEVHGHLEDQCITQYGLFDSIVKKSVTLPTTQNNKDMWETKVKVCDALLEATHGSPGPVHINVPQRGIELRPSPIYSLVLPDVKKVERVSYIDFSRGIKTFVNALASKKKIMLICGQTPYDSEYNNLIGRFTERYNCVAVGDTTSNISGPNVIHPSRLLKALEQKDYDSRYSPDLIIQLGDNKIMGRSLTPKIRSGKDVEIWKVSSDGVLADVYHKLPTIIECPPMEFLTMMVNGADSNCTNDHVYYQKWASSIPEPEEVNEWTTKYVVKTVVPMIPDNSLLHLGAGNSFAFAQSCDISPSVEVYANRGVNGIDGCASSFMGQCAVAPENQLCFLLIGDLTFFYDMNSLWNKSLTNKVRILLSNDAGAGLLRYHASPAITQGHAAIAEGWVKTLGFKYLRATNREEFLDNLKLFLDPNYEGPVFFECFVNP